MSEAIKKNGQSDANILRQKANEWLARHPGKISAQSSVDEMLKIIHELEVHQIELEMQNNELKLAKEQAELAKDKYSELYALAPNGYFTLSAKGEIIDLNLPGAQMLEKKLQQLIGSRLGIFVSEDSRPIFNHFLDEVFIGKVKKTCKVTIITDKKRPLMVLLSGIAHESRKHCLVTAVDNTEHQQVEKELQRIYEMNTLFMKYSPIYAYIKEVTPGESRVLMASENFIELVGIPGSEMVGKNMHDLFPADFAAKITADDWKVVSSGKVLKVDEPINGHHYFTIKYPILLDNKNLLAGYTIDITERIRAENEIKLKNEELSKLNAEKDKYFSIIAHD